MPVTIQDYLHEFYAALPPPPDNTPEATAARRELALHHLTSLRPEGAHEIALAIEHVLCWWQSLSTLQLRHAARDPEEARRCQRQAASMSRQSLAALRLLHAEQRARGIRPVRPAAIRAAAPPAEPAPPPPPPRVAAQPDSVAAAEDFARQFPRRAVQIRRAKGVPPDITYQPPAPPVIAALVAGMTKPLRRLDRIPA